MVVSNRHVVRLCYAQKYDHLQAVILNLMCRTDYALDLAESNPVLLWLIAGQVKSECITISQGVALIARKQRLILRTLFPENDVISVRFTRRIEPVAYDSEEFVALQSVIDDPQCVRPLRHCTRVNLKALSRFDYTPFTLSLPLVKGFLEQESCDLHQCDQVQKLIDSGLDDSIQINHRYPWESMSRCRTVEQLQKLCEKWQIESLLVQGLFITVDDLRDDGELLGLYPPIAQGVRHIEPITSIMGLLIEGEDMEHCISQYAEDVRQGVATAYRVLSPERGTLLLTHDPDGYKIEEFKLADNKEPSPEAWSSVQFWVKYLNQSAVKVPRTVLPV